jgi:malate dehydrogenase
MKKVSIIGAGNVGGTAAMRIFESGLARVALIDIAENLARAKACDLEDAQYAAKFDNRIEASGDFASMDASDIVVVTAGLPRKPGMTREDLLEKNLQIMAKVCDGTKRFAKGAIVIVVSNPLDVMTYAAYKFTGFPRQRVFGMGANLDASRFANLVARKLLVGTQDVKPCVIGSHGETMLPLPRLTTVRDRPLPELLKDEEIQELVKQTRQRGAEIVGLYGSGSAFYAPSAAIFEIVKLLLSGEMAELPVSVCLDGEYGARDVSIGVPARISARGIEEVIELELTAPEKEAFENSVEAIQKSIRTCPTISA